MSFPTTYHAWPAGGVNRRSVQPAGIFCNVPLVPAWVALAVLASPMAQAGGDHDHAHEQEHAAPEAAGSPAGLPRLTAVSEAFELVGVLNGKHLTLYLDRFADGSPVTHGRIELELGAARYTLTAGPDGDYRVTLPHAPAPGALPVTVTVLAGEQSDLLAGVLTVPGAAEAGPAAPQGRAGQWLAWGGGGVLALCTGLLWWRARARAASKREVA